MGTGEGMCAKGGVIWGGKAPFGVFIWQGMFFGQKQLGPQDTARKTKEKNGRKNRGKGEKRG